MASRTIEAALLRRLERGDYVVDESAVAEAMVASGVLVALQPGNLLAMLVQKDESSARHDLA
jgi:hypothetical protein